jgi:uncharacterized phiE125 gp8 family phage protein
MPGLGGPAEPGGAATSLSREPDGPANRVGPSHFPSKRVFTEFSHEVADMALFRTVPPGAEPLTLAECKAHLRISQDGEDALIAGLVRAAREEVESHTGVAMIDQDWRLALDAWPASGIVTIPRHPVKQILSVTLYGRDGEASLMDPGSYRLDGLSRPARLRVEDRPAPGASLNGIEIDFRAGFGEAGPDVPDLLKRAMLLLVAHWYEFRAAWGPDDQPVSIPEGFRRLTDGWRARRL